MQVTIQPSILHGTIVAPASKSSMQRACAAALVRKGHTIIHNPGISNDDLAALQVITTLGAEVETLADGSLHINSNGIHPISAEVNHGESGLGIRMFAPLVALHNNEMTINGEGSLRSRPMDFFDTVFPQLGIQVQSNQGRLPLVVKGPLRPANITIDGSLSSQFLTGLLMAYSAADAKDVSITVQQLKSKPYVDLTLKVMEDFGLKLPINNSYESFYFTPDSLVQSDKSIEYTVESDWSGAAFLLVAGAVAGNITVKGLDPFSTQADKAVLQALMDCGAVLSIQPNNIEIGPSPLKAFNFNATDCPDLFPPLVALAANCEGTTVIEGVKRLAHKESDRGITLQQEFAKLGIEIILQDDLMLIKGGTGIKTAITHSRHDHRIAMAAAVAALKANGSVTIEDAEAVRKSYPNFFEHLQQLGAGVTYLS